MIEKLPDIAKETDAAITMIEDGYARMVTGLYKLRKAGLYKIEHEELSHIIGLLEEDQSNLESKYEEEIYGQN
jgi:hypothetical protein